MFTATGQKKEPERQSIVPEVAEREKSKYKKNFDSGLVTGIGNGRKSQLNQIRPHRACLIRYTNQYDLGRIIGFEKVDIFPWIRNICFTILWKKQCGTFCRLRTI